MIAIDGPASAISPPIGSRSPSSCDSGPGISELTYILSHEQPSGGFSKIMTERPSSISTQIATPLQATSNPPASIPAHDATSAVETAEDRIKCICGYIDDDGSTIFCENCRTWQHIECFYPGRAEEALDDKFEHHCADCKPRYLDKKQAREWQRTQLENKGLGDINDKKSKRPQSKSHKKKPKPSDVQINGFHDDDRQRNGSPQDPPNTKKSKGHRPTQSVSSQLKRSPPYNGRPNPNHPPSPAHTPPDLPPDVAIHTFSETFEQLYDDSQSFTQSSNNTLGGQLVTNTMIGWLRDFQKLQQDTGVTDEEEVFSRLKQPHDHPLNLTWPELRVNQRDVPIDDIPRRFRSLVTRTSIKSHERIGELNGLVGIQKTYTDDPANQWQSLLHAKPFVFFAAGMLPLYIDARSEGSDCRYARRSCRPNAILETFISNGAEYRFWLTSERQLNPEEQITLGWDFKFPPQVKDRYLQLLHLADGEPSDGADMTDDEYSELSNLISLVLSDHGGCACDLGNDCAFARFHRSYYHGRLQHQSNGTKSKKARKPKQNHVSPTSTGHATNSRAASEGQQDQYDDDDDSRSVSGSVRSKPHSRDLTPVHDVSANGILTEPTEREKRKMAAYEDSFRKMDQSQPPRKKHKRASEGSTTASSTIPQPKPRQRSVAPRAPTSQLANGSRTSKYVDASTSRRESDSPLNARSPPSAGPISRDGSVAYRSRQVSVTPKATYITTGTQTDEVADAWWSRPAQLHPKRSMSCLSKRLLKNRLKLQPQIEARRAAMAGIDDTGMVGSPTVSMDLDGPGHDERSNPGSPVDSRGRNPSIASSTPSVDVPTSTDVNMMDAPAIMVGNAIKPPPPPWPGQLNPSSRSNSISSHRSPDLRVQLPAVPIFTVPNMAGTSSGNVTPSSASASIAQSPFGTNFLPTFPAPTVNGAVQSPAKGPKKLSMSDYKARQAKKEEKKLDGSSPTITPAVLKPSSTIEEAKAAGILEGSAIVETPVAEKTLDPLASITSPTDTTSKDNLPLPNGTL